MATPSVKRAPNAVRAIREDKMLTKAELARAAGISALTLARIEAGSECRVDTMRKILFALGMEPTDKDRVFGTGAAPDDGEGAPLPLQGDTKPRRDLSRRWR